MRVIAPTMFVFFLFVSCSGPQLRRASNYTLDPPNTWTKESRAESDRAYRLQNGSIVTVTSSCDRDTYASLELLTRHLLIGTRNIRNIKQVPLTVSNSPALHTSAKASGTNAPIFLELVVIKRTPCTFDFSLISQTPVNGNDIEEFLQFVRNIKFSDNT